MRNQSEKKKLKKREPGDGIAKLGREKIQDRKRKK